MVRGFIALGFMALAAIAPLPPATAEDAAGGALVVVDGTEVTAKTADGKTTAELSLINGGDQPATLTDFLVTAGCEVTPKTISVPARQSTTVELTLEEGCPRDSAVTLDLDGAGKPLPAITIKPPAKPETGTMQRLLPGLKVGAVLALLTLLLVEVRRRQLVDELATPAAAAEREEARARLEARIRVACTEAGVAVDPDKLAEVTSDPPETGWTTALKGLDVSWKFSDSWLGNANVAAAGVVTLLSTTDLLEVLFAEVPKAVTAAIAAGAAVALVLVALANATLRAIGPQTKVPTVLGFALAAALSVLATSLNLVTLASALDSAPGDLGMGEAAPWVVWGMAVLALALMLKYVYVSAGEVLKSGLTSTLPAVSDTVKAAWVVAGAVQPDLRTAGLSPWEVSDYAATYGSEAAQPAGVPPLLPTYPSPRQLHTSRGDEPLGRVSAML